MTSEPFRPARESFAASLATVVPSERTRWSKKCGWVFKFLASTSFKKCKSAATVRTSVYPTLKVVIEVDSEYWHQDEEKDSRRDRILKRYGWTTIRLSEETVRHTEFMADLLEDLLASYSKVGR